MLKMAFRNRGAHLCVAGPPEHDWSGVTTDYFYNNQVRLARPADQVLFEGAGKPCVVHPSLLLGDTAGIVRVR